MIDTFRNTTPDICQRLLEKVEIKQEPVTVSATQKVDDNHGFLDSLFCGPMIKRLTPKLPKNEHY